MNQLQQNLSECLLETTDLTEFVTKAFALYLDAHPRANYAGLARRMAFTSRSFVRQLALGTRRPNLTNYRKISAGLELTDEATEYFGLLLEKQKGNHGTIRSKRRIVDAEIKLRRSMQKKVIRSRKTDVIPFERWPFIYAALGTLQEGRTIPEIMRISGQDPKTCLEILDHLVKKELVTFDIRLQKYFPKAEMVELGELGESRVLKNLFKLLNIEAVRRIETELNKDNTLFHSSIFSVQADQLPHLAKDLQKVLSSYAAKAEDSKGEVLALLNASMIPLKMEFIT